MVFRALVFLSSSLVGAVAHAAVISEKRLELLFRPPLGESLALSTDGSHLAYTEHRAGTLGIVVMDLERLETRTRIHVDDDRPILHSKEKQPARLRFLEWADARRLVFAPTLEVIPAPPPPPSVPGFPRPAIPQPTIIAPVQAVNADGTAPQLLADARTFALFVEAAGSMRMRTPHIRGFEPGPKREHLLIEVHDGGTGEGTDLLRLNVFTGARTRLDNNLGRGHRFVYDWDGRARLNVAQERDGTTTLYHRARDSERWQQLPEPAGAPPGVRFSTEP